MRGPGFLTHSRHSPVFNRQIICRWRICCYVGYGGWQGNRKSPAQDLPKRFVGKGGIPRLPRHYQRNSMGNFQESPCTFFPPFVTVPSFVFTKIVHRIRIRTSDPIFEPEKTAILWNWSMCQSGKTVILKIWRIALPQIPPQHVRWCSQLYINLQHSWGASQLFPSYPPFLDDFPII